jgi:hypothetical protein
MNQIQDWETQLRSWQPRQASPKIKQRLFTPEPEAAATGPLAGHLTRCYRAVLLPMLMLLRGDQRFHLSWLVPASALFLLLCLVNNPHGGSALEVTTNAEPVVILAVSNQNAAQGLTAPSTNFRKDTFEWTNRSRSTSSISSSPGLRGKINE